MSPGSVPTSLWTDGADGSGGGGGGGGRSPDPLPGQCSLSSTQPMSSRDRPPPARPPPSSGRERPRTSKSPTHLLTHRRTFRPSPRRPLTLRLTLPFPRNNSGGPLVGDPGGRGPGRREPSLDSRKTDLRYRNTSRTQTPRPPGTLSFLSSWSPPTPTPSTGFQVHPPASYGPTNRDFQPVQTSHTSPHDTTRHTTHDTTRHDNNPLRPKDRSLLSNEDGPNTSLGRSQRDPDSHVNPTLSVDEGPSPSRTRPGPRRMVEEPPGTLSRLRGPRKDSDPIVLGIFG